MALLTHMVHPERFERPTAWFVACTIKYKQLFYLNNW